jgi:hypothetical protein
MGGFILLEMGLFLGMFIGMFIGGNFLTEFEFAGSIGPEAVGNVGFIVGAAIGALFGALLGVKLADNKAARVYGKYLVIIFVLSITSMLFLLSHSPDERLTLEQAQTEADFTIYEPAYLPENVGLGVVEWMDTGVKDTLYLRYFKKTPVFEMTESKLIELKIDPNSAEVDISGTTGYLYKQGNTTYLTWHQNDTELTISTEVLSEEEILKVARSIKKYE